MSLASRATSLRLAWPAVERGSVFLGRVNPRRKTCQQHSGASQTAAVSPACARKEGNRGTGARGVWGGTFWQRQQGWSRVRKDTVVPNLVLLWHPATPSWLHPGVPACSCLFLPVPARSCLLQGQHHPSPPLLNLAHNWVGATPSPGHGAPRAEGGICLPGKPGGRGWNRTSSVQGWLRPAEGPGCAWGTGWDPRQGGARPAPPGGTPEI